MLYYFYLEVHIHKKQIFLQVFGDTTSPRAVSFSLFGPSSFYAFKIQLLGCNPPSQGWFKVGSFALAAENLDSLF